jgi:hypothetical protein
MVEQLQWHQVHECDPAHQWFRVLLNRVVQGLRSEPAVGVRAGRPARVSARS